MNIVHVIESLDESYGGPAKSLPYLIRAQAKLGHNVMVVSVDGELSSNEYVCDFDIEWIKSEKTSSAFYFSKDFHKKINSIFCRFSPDVVHIHSVWSYPSILSMFYSWAKRVPYFLSPRSSLYLESLKKSYFKKKVLRFLFLDRLILRSSGIHVTEEDEGKDVKKLYPSLRVMNSSHGIDLDEMAILPSKEISCSILGVDDNFRYALFLSRIHPRKNVDKLIRSWLSIKPEMDGWKLIIAGSCDDPTYLDHLEEMVKCSSYKEDIMFFPFLRGDKKAAAFGACEIFILPSNFENFGMAIAEAMAASKPVVVGVNSPWKMVVESGAGYCVDPNVDSIKNVLVELSRETPTSLKDKGVKARKLVSEGFSWDRQAEDLIELYKIPE